MRFIIQCGGPCLRYTHSGQRVKYVRSDVLEWYEGLLLDRSPRSEALRRRKVFIDWSQNSDFKTTVGVYSLRAKSHKSLVSMPVSWKELETAVSANNSESLYFDPSEAITRAEEIDDLFKPVLSKKQFLANEPLVRCLHPPSGRGWFRRE